MMGAVAAAARGRCADRRGDPAHADRPEVADEGVDELLVTETMRERKALMEAHADAFPTLPGGIGTCEEFFEVWTSGTLGCTPNPSFCSTRTATTTAFCAGCGTSGGGFLHDGVLARVSVVHDVDVALDACTRVHAKLTL